MAHGTHPVPIPIHLPTVPQGPGPAALTHSGPGAGLPPSLPSGRATLTFPLTVCGHPQMTPPSHLSSLPGLVSTARTRLQTAMITAMSPAPRTVFGTQQVFSTCLLNDQSQGPSLPRPGRRQRLPQQPPASPPQPASALFPWAASSQLCSHAI